MLAYERLITEFPSDRVTAQAQPSEPLTSAELAEFREMIRESLFAGILQQNPHERVYIVKDGACVFVEVPFGKNGFVQLDLDPLPALHHALIDELRMYARHEILIHNRGVVRLEGDDVVFEPFTEPSDGNVVLFRPR